MSIGSQAKDCVYRFYNKQAYVSNNTGLHITDTVAFVIYTCCSPPPIWSPAADIQTRSNPTTVPFRNFIELQLYWSFTVTSPHRHTPAPTRLSNNLLRARNPQITILEMTLWGSNGIFDTWIYKINCWIVNKILKTLNRVTQTNNHWRIHGWGAKGTQAPPIANSWYSLV